MGKDGDTIGRNGLWSEVGTSVHHYERRVEKSMREERVLVSAKQTKREVFHVACGAQDGDVKGVRVAKRALKEKRVEVFREIDR